MEQEKIEHFKKKLETEREEVISNLRSVAVQVDENDPHNWEAREPQQENQEAERNEVAEEIEQYGANDIVTEELEDRLRNIDAALERIEKGTYGVDKFDGEPIEEKRLEANPAAETRIANMERKS